MERSDFDDKVVLGAILCLALILRIVGLNQPLWYDELLTLFTHIQIPWAEMMSGYEMNHHYLFSFQAKLSALIFGEAPWSLRLPAVLFGVGAIGATWVLVRDVADTRIAHVTALLLALSYHHIWFSQNARGYTELMFWCTLGLILFLRGTQSSSMRPWLWFAVVLALAVFTHLTGFFFFFAIGTVWLCWAIVTTVTGARALPSHFGAALGFLLGGLITAALYAPVLPGVFENAATVGGTSQVDVMQEFQNPLWTVLEAIRTVANGLGPLIGAVAVLIVFLCFLGALRIWQSAPLFPLIVLAHIVLTMALLLALGMRIWPRFFFVDIGFLLALIVLGVAEVCTRTERFLPVLRARLTFLLSAVAMVVISTGLAAQNYRAPKQNIPGALDLVTENIVAGEKAYAVGFIGDIYSEHLQTGWGRIMTNDDLANALSAAQASSERLWLVVGFPQRTFRAVSSLEDAVTGFDLVQRFDGTLGDGALLVYRQK